MTKNFVIVFDIPRNMPVLALRVNRSLKKMGAKMFQHSVWKCEKLDELLRLANLIKSHGGKAAILEERFIFE